MYELHGREDGRTRSFVFVQMLLLALLAVFIADAAGEEDIEGNLVGVDAETGQERLMVTPVR